MEAACGIPLSKALRLVVEPWNGLRFKFRPLRDHVRAHLVFVQPAHLKFLCHRVLLVCVCLPKYAPHPTLINVPSQRTPATTLTVIAMMITLKKKDTTLCSITSLRMLLDDTATSEVWQHMLNTTAKYVKSQ